MRRKHLIYLVVGILAAASLAASTATDAKATVIPCALYGNAPYKTSTYIAARAQIVCPAGAQIKAMLYMYRNGLQVSRIFFGGYTNVSTADALTVACKAGNTYQTKVVAELTMPGAEPWAGTIWGATRTPTSCA